LVIAERECSKGATRRRQQKGLELGSLRMKMEGYIEEQISKIAGIDIDSLKKIQLEELEEKKELDKHEE
jgi:predicted transposase YdaD